MLEKTLESSLNCKGPVKGSQPWIFIGRTDVEAEAPILWPPDANSWLIGKDLDAGKDWGQEEQGTTEDEMFGWHHWLDGHEFEQSGRWWRTAKSVTLQSMELQRAGHSSVTEQRQQHNIVKQLYSYKINSKDCYWNVPMINFKNHLNKKRIIRLYNFLCCV